MQVNAVYYKAVAHAASSIQKRECKCDARLCNNVDVLFCMRFMYFVSIVSWTRRSLFLFLLEMEKLLLIPILNSDIFCRWSTTL